MFLKFERVQTLRTSSSRLLRTVRHSSCYPEKLRSIQNQLDHVVAKTDNDENSRSGRNDVFNSGISVETLLKDENSTGNKSDIFDNIISEDTLLKLYLRG